jgi:hypothetical protein
MVKAKMQVVVRISAWALVVGTVSAFQSTTLSKNGIQSKSYCQSNNLPRSNRRQCTMRQSQDLQPAELVEQEEMIDFFVSPVQIAFLRKEANKRESNKRLLKFSLPPPETAEISHETIGDIANLFDRSELIEVRGVSKDAKKKVFDSANGLAATLEEALGKPVVVVDINGFAVKLYCPWDEDGQGERGGRIQLRTNFRPGQWVRKAKPIRDTRGQIITDDEGMSVKEIPE